jgi:hypothetical protein
MHFEEHLTEYQKSGVNSFSQQTKKSIYNFIKLSRRNNTVDPVYSERVGAAKIVYNNRVFTINIFNLTIN